MDDARLTRVAENESLFRDINEAVEVTAQRFSGAGETVQEFLCECGDTGCVERVPLAIAEYESVRANGSRFVIVDGHEIEDAERVVERTDRYAVVEKLGAGSDVAERRNPRAGGAT